MFCVLYDKSVIYISVLCLGGLSVLLRALFSKSSMYSFTTMVLTGDPMDGCMDRQIL